MSQPPGSAGLDAILEARERFNDADGELERALESLVAGRKDGREMVLEALIVHQGAYRTYTAEILSRVSVLWDACRREKDHAERAD